MTARRIDFSEPPSARVPVLDKGNLHRVLNTRHLFAIGYGDVGSSIYYALGVTTLYALGATPLALALAGIVFFCTVLTYAELSAAMPESGGSCSFARHAFNDLVSFIAGWALLLDYIVTIAISAYSIGPYLRNLLPGLHGAGNVPFTLMVLALLLAINIAGIKESTRISLLLCTFDIVTQVAVIGFGLVLIMEVLHPQQFWGHLQVLWHHLQIGGTDPVWSPTWPHFWKGVGMAMVAYIGIESISQLSGEARHPNVTVPRAMLTTMVTLFVLYFGVSMISLSVLNPQELTTVYLEDPLAGIAASMPYGWGRYLAPWVGLLGATILFVAANAGLIGASRLTFAMSEHFGLPRLFYRLHPKFKTPYISLMVFTGIAGLIVVVARNLTHIADLYNFGAMLSFALAHLSLMGLRIRQPGLARPFKIGWNIPVGKYELPFTSILGLLGTAAVWVDVILTKPAGRNLGCVWIGAGLVLYLWYRHQQKLPVAARVELEKLIIPSHKDIVIRKILVPLTSVSTADTTQFAAKLAKVHGADITALHIIEIPPSLPLDTFFPEKLALADSLLQQAQAIGREYEVPVETQIQQARFAGETIVDLAKDGGYDVIILTDTPRLLAAAPGVTTFGTTVEYVMKNAPCRVWLFTGKS